MDIKIMKKLLPLILILVFSMNVFPEEYMPEKRDPFIAGFLSWSMVGMGQFYNKEYAKGSVFLFSDLLQKGLLVIMIVDFNRRYGTEDGEWMEFQDKDKILVVGYAAMYIGLRIYSIVDAVNAAKKFNARLDDSLRIKASTGGCDFSYSRRF